jgi:hypothetical protein
MALGLYGSRALGLHGSMALCLYASMPLWPYGSMALWLGLAEAYAKKNCVSFGETWLHGPVAL